MTLHQGLVRSIDSLGEYTYKRMLVVVSALFQAFGCHFHNRALPTDAQLKLAVELVFSLRPIQTVDERKFADAFAPEYISSLQAALENFALEHVSVFQFFGGDIARAALALLFPEGGLAPMSLAELLARDRLMTRSADSALRVGTVRSLVFTLIAAQVWANPRMSAEDLKVTIMERIRTHKPAGPDELDEVDYSTRGRMISEMLAG